MGRNCIEKWWLMFVICACFAAKLAVNASGVASFGAYHEHGRRLDDVAGSISIDCGISQDSGYIEDITEIPYSSDAKFIDSGVNSDISSKFISENLHKSLANVRSFPKGTRNCYTLSPPEGKDTIYLIRAWFMYGDYDDEDQLPEFDLYVGVNLWDTVKFDNASHIVIKEITHAPLMDNIYVCLFKTGSTIPFISALELRHFHDFTYRVQAGSLALYTRLDVGSTSHKIVRFKEDALDRIWFPYNIPRSLIANTSNNIDSLEETTYKLPSVVMETAARPYNANESLDFEFSGDPILDFYVYMHFAEVEELQENEYREFDVALNGNPWSKTIVPKYLQSTTVNGTGPVRGSNLKFSLHKTSKSTLPPILNAMEIYVVKEFLQQPTSREEGTFLLHFTSRNSISSFAKPIDSCIGDAMMDIKSSYKVARSWQGDPCLPVNSWDGLNCSSNGYDPPRILLLNLSSSGLTGKIDPALSNLKSLQYLDLSNNSLTGELPSFLSELPNLKELNVEGNKLSGPVPSLLMERSKTGSLSLSMGGNPDLCLSEPCKRDKKNYAIPIIATVVASIVLIFIALVILWKCKRKQAERVVKFHEDEEGTLKSENRHFTYSEVVNVTNNFQKVIGKGGFGTVYHGVLNDGTQVAVKMLSQSSSQGSKQFRTEAQLLMRVHHRNLASLVGYCNEGPNVGIIYEYMANGNLQDHLLDKTKSVLSWKERIQIAVDAAQGLDYLHHGCKPPIIHRDVKTANILLNEKMQAKIADFGFSRSFPAENESHLSTSVVGTLGYLDPEYFTSNRLTEKSDVYSFGMVLLELITGQPVLIKTHGSKTHIVQWVSALLTRGDIASIVDERLEGNFDMNSMWKAMEIAMACVPAMSIQRPTMSNVSMELKECLEIEFDREQQAVRYMDGQVKKEKKKQPSNSFDQMQSLDFEIEMGPLAR